MLRNKDFQGLNKIYQCLLLTIFYFSCLNTDLFSQNGSIMGRISDANTGEELIGATIIIQGTTKGTISDLSGSYLLAEIPPGIYNIVYSFVSYNTVIQKAVIEKGQTIEINVNLLPATVELNEVKVIARKRLDTEVSMISSIKSGNLIVSGISSQQISRSMDKDAAEVIRRVPGITITDNKFVIVRGLSERYNSVLLNGSVAPSFESDKRSFAFDALPSNMIDNILVYKSPAPELPADFAGAAINVMTKNTADDNSTFINYSFGYNNETTFTEFYTYKGGQYDWLGFDDGTRKLPTSFPNSKEMVSLFDFSGTVENNNEKKAQLESISKAFNNESFYVRKTKANPNQNVLIGINRRFVAGNITFGNLTALNYSYTNDINHINKAEYKLIDPFTFKENPAYEFNDDVYKTNTRLGLLHNWLVIFGNNQRIEFRNYLAQLSRDRTILRSGENYYIGSEPDTLLGRELNFNSRSIYSGQVAGYFNINKTQTKIELQAGYGYTLNDNPDIKRLRYSKQYNPLTESREYRLIIPTSVVPYETGRLYLKLNENIINYSFNLKQPFLFLNRNFLFKTGLFYEQKKRDFNARNIGIRQARSNSFRLNTFLSEEELLKDSNFYFNEGLTYGESYNASNSYKIKVNNFAWYASAEIPITNRVVLYGGLRSELYKRVLSGFQENPELIPDITFDTIDFFPSVMLTYKLNDKQQLRLSYGKTINRPEFREIVPYAFVDFQRFATIYGNDSLKNCYVQNYDIRYEIYPSESEVISLALFYKRFKNPIEILLYPGSNGWEYIPFNTEKSVSMGIELDLRKRFSGFENSNSIFQYLKNITILFNASYINSKVTTHYSFARDKNRPMVGQSPYIINAGFIYQVNRNQFMVSILYNRIGKRIAALGSKDYPNTWEISGNSLDISFSKGFGKSIEIKGGIKNLLDDAVVLQQDWNYEKNSSSVTKSLNTEYYTEGRIMNLGFIYRF
jgi:outer membrane receptor for ferrienterochelin and colicin